jgi:hypothetical protein
MVGKIMNDKLLKQMLSVLPDEELKTINKFIWEILKERNQAARSLMEVVGKMVEMWRNGTRYDLNHLDRLSEVWPKDKCIHTEHCCKNCGCKYGESTTAPW